MQQVHAFPFVDVALLFLFIVLCWYRYYSSTSFSSTTMLYQLPVEQPPSGEGDCCAYPPSTAASAPTTLGYYNNYPATTTFCQRTSLLLPYHPPTQPVAVLRPAQLECTQAQRHTFSICHFIWNEVGGGVQRETPTHPVCNNLKGKRFSLPMDDCHRYNVNNNNNNNLCTFLLLVHLYFIFSGHLMIVLTGQRGGG